MKHYLASGLAALMLTASPAYGQEAPSAPQAEENISALSGFFSSQIGCLGVYKYGSVKFNFEERNHLGTVITGDAVQVSGRVTNTNDFALPHGKIYARVLRHSAQVADDQWHPYVHEEWLPAEYPLEAGQGVDFTYDWQVPGLTPEGRYEIDFFYLANGRFVMAGVPYVVNMPGGMVIFEVKGAGVEAAVNFDRASVLVNGEPFKLRAIPDTLPANEAVKVDAMLMNDSSAAMSVKLTKELFAWSDTDREAPVATQAPEVVTLEPGKKYPVSFIWDNAMAGVHELVLTATPATPEVLPSVLRVRFPIEGNVPRIIYSGVTKIEGDTATVTTCAVNGTYGEGSGSVKTSMSAKGGVIGEETTNTGLTSILFASTFEVPAENVLQGKATSLKVAAYDDKGTETDSATVNYGLEEEAQESMDTAVNPFLTGSEKEENTFGVITWTILGLILLALLAVGIFALRTKMNNNDSSSL